MTRTVKRQPIWVIGILTMPHARGRSHVMKAYVDAIEMRGVRVRLIPYDTDAVEEYATHIHGLLVPGGDTTYVMKNRTFLRTVRRFLEESFSSPNPFPVWGTCFGMEALMAVIGDIRRFDHFPAHGATRIHITDRDAQMLRIMTKKQRVAMEHTGATAQNHEFGISPLQLAANPHLRRFFKVVATAVDEKGRDYVAAVEGRFFPVFGVMWHPERQSVEEGGPWMDAFVYAVKHSGRRPFSTAQGTVARLAARLPASACSHYPEHQDLRCYFV